MRPLVAPSVLSADFANLAKDIEFINQSAAHWVHCDIMDGVFVPNLSFGIPVLEAIAQHSAKPLDVHLMLADPDRHIPAVCKAGAHIITVHYEASTHLHRTLELIKSEGVQAGVALNPHTPVHMLMDILPILDIVLIMSVNPGFGGQKFIPHTLHKVKQLHKMITDLNCKTHIEVDGGVNAENAPLLRAAGANVLVAGSFIFNAPNRDSAIAALM